MYKDRYFAAFSGLYLVERNLYLVEREAPKMRYIPSLEVDTKQLSPAMVALLVCATRISNWLELFVYEDREYEAYAKSLLLASDELCWLDATGCIDAPV
jgi:hypothetical protein